MGSKLTGKAATCHVHNTCTQTFCSFSQSCRRCTIVFANTRWSFFMRLLYRMEVSNIWRRFLSLSRLECVAWTLLWDKLTVLPSSFTVHDGWNAFAWVLGWTWSCRLQVRLINPSMSSEGKACFCPNIIDWLSHRLQFLHRVTTCTACHIPSQCSVYTMFGQYIFKSENWIFARLSLPILI